jgi:predicted nucleic acid-binding protein
MFLDTSGLLAFLHRSERNHLQARKLFESASARLTQNYILAEFIALANARKLPREPVLNFVDELQRNDLVEVVYVKKDLHLRALELLRQRIDKSWSLCDGVSFLIMQDRGVTEALTTDHHFEQAGFIKLLESD